MNIILNTASDFLKKDKFNEEKLTKLFDDLAKKIGTKISESGDDVKGNLSELGSLIEEGQKINTDKILEAQTGFLERQQKLNELYLDKRKIENEIKSIKNSPAGSKTATESKEKKIIKLTEDKKDLDKKISEKNDERDLDFTELLKEFSKNKLFSSILQGSKFKQSNTDINLDPADMKIFQFGGQKRRFCSIKNFL